MHACTKMVGLALLVLAARALGQPALPLDLPDDAVQTWAQDGDTLYIAGSFSNLSQHTGALAVSDRDTGEIVRFDDVVGRQVDALASDGAGGWVVAGAIAPFGEAGSSLAHIRADGSLRVLDFSVASRSVYDLAVHGSTVFIAGGFTGASPVTGRYLMALDLDSGLVLPWNPGIDDDVLDMEIADGWLYAAGAYGVAGGQPRVGLARFDASSRALDTWSSEVIGRYSRVSVHGDRVYYRGSGVQIQAQTFDHLVGAVSAATGEPIAWRPEGVDFSTIHGVRATDEGVYIAGSFERVGAFARLGVALLSEADASVLPFRADVQRDQPSPADVHEVLVCGDAVLLEGVFESVDGQPRLGTALVERTSGALRPWSVDAPHEDRYAVGATGSQIALGGRFVGVNPEPRNRIAAVDLVSGRVLPFAPDLTGPSGSPMSVLQILPSDGRVLLVGNFSTADGIPVKGFIAVDGDSGRWTSGSTPPSTPTPTGRWCGRPTASWPAAAAASGVSP